MKGTGVIGVSLVAFFVGIAGVPALGAYISIQHNLVNGATDVSYDALSGVLTMSDSSTNLTLNDDPALTGGAVQSATFVLNTTFKDFDTTFPGKALFTGGSLSLNFDYDADVNDSNPAQSYSIGGPISGLVIDIDELIAGSLYRINGAGLFNAGTPTLPGSNVWPATGLSSIDTLSVSVKGEDLSGWDWTETIDGTGETQYTLFPNDNAAPEPAALALLGLGALGFTRRRRA